MYHERDTDHKTRLLGLNSRRLSSPRHEDMERRWESEMLNGDNNSGMRIVIAPRSPINEHPGSIYRVVKR
jgi:hypothetical protein